MKANNTPEKEVLTPTEKEVTGSEWKLEFDIGSGDESCCEWYNLINPDGDSVAKIPDQRDANRIITCVNGYDELQKGIKYAEKVAYETSVANANLITKNAALKADNAALVSALKELHQACMMDIDIPTAWWKKHSNTVANAKELLLKIS